MTKAIINVKLGDKNARCFIDSGSFFHEFSGSSYHRHSYAEIHLVIAGTGKYHIEKSCIDVSAGSVVFIPAGTYHCVKTDDKSLSYAAIQVETDKKGVWHKLLGIDFLKKYEMLLKQATEDENFASISAWIGFICASVMEDLFESATESADYAYAINDFIGRFYNRDVTICDLASYLGLSEKQTTRLVKKHTNKTFLQNILEARMLTADYLFENTDMPMTEIAQHVGYNSYGGFLKARKKYLLEHGKY